MNKLYIPVLVAYDVTDNKKRQRLRQELLSLGLKDLQLSVMWGWLRKPDLAAVELLFRQLLDENTDKAFWIRVDYLEDCMRRQGFGHKNDKLPLPDAFDVL